MSIYGAWSTADLLRASVLTGDVRQMHAMDDELRKRGEIDDEQWAINLPRRAEELRRLGR